jgi:hypothetical protein
MKDIKEPALILLVLFILVGLAYGPSKNINLKNNNTARNPDSSIGTAGNNDTGYSSNKIVAEEIKTTESDIKNLAQNVNNEIDKSQHSPYYGKIKMSSVYGFFNFYNSDPDREYIYLSTNLNKTETIKITGWYLKSDITSYYVVIGRAALLPFPFTKTESDVTLQSGDRVYLIKGFSPIGISFRTNKCTGYFAENRSFTPGIYSQCPLPKNEKLPTFSSDYDRNDECLNIIDRIPQCTTINSQFIRDLPDTVPQSCKDYMLNQINYNTCVTLHFSDTDFPGNEYRIYLNKFGPLWRQRSDKIVLRDQNGLIVDSISY